MSTACRPGDRESFVATVPETWETAALSDVIDKLMDFRGKTPRKLGMDWGGGDIPALSANNVRMGFIDFDRECYLGSEALYDAWMVHGDTKPFDLVFTMEAPLGNVAVIPDDRKYILSQRVILLRPNERVHFGYLFQYLKSDLFSDILDVNATGTTAKGIQQKRLIQLPILLPSLFEQQKIAAILTAVDDKLDVIARQVTATQALKQGLMQTLFTKGVGTQGADGRWVPHAKFNDSELGPIPAGWRAEKLEALTESITVGIATSTTKHYADQGIPLIRNQNIKEDFLDMSDLLHVTPEFDAKNKSKRVREGDILTVRTGYPGVSCVVPKGVGELQTFTTLITRTKPTLLNSHFASRYFNSPQGKSGMLHQAAGGAQQNINAGNLKNLLVPVPPLAEQEKIVTVLEVVDDKVCCLQLKQAHYQTLKRGLMQKLLTGEWRVKVDNAEHTLSAEAA